MADVTHLDVNRANQWVDAPRDTPARVAMRDRLALLMAMHREAAEKRERDRIIDHIRRESVRLLGTASASDTYDLKTVDIAVTVLEETAAALAEGSREK